jgi:hypothetical protein
LRDALLSFMLSGGSILVGQEFQRRRYEFGSWKIDGWVILRPKSVSYSQLKLFLF